MIKTMRVHSLVERSWSQMNNRRETVLSNATRVVVAVQ